MLARSIAVMVLTVGALGAQQESPQRPEREPTPREVAREAAKELKAALKTGERDTILTAFRIHGLIDDTDVAHAVGKAVASDADPVVLWSALTTLRYNPNKAAASELRSALREKAVQDNPALTALVFRGLGQHRDPRAMRMLIEGFGPKPEHDLIRRARIDAVGRYQNRVAINAMIKFARSGFVGEELEEHVCLALRGQTGENHGEKLRPWVLWWNQGKKSWELPDPAPTPPAAWERIWRVPSPERMFDDVPGLRGGPITGERPDGEEERGRGGGRGRDR